jgi:predicted nucleotidyltransferase
MKIPPQLEEHARQHPYRLLFVTLSGAHLYGFPSANSDYDLRGVHLLPLPELVGLNSGPETVEENKIGGELEIDLVTHEAKKFFSLLLKKNGYVLEQLLSPLVVHTTLGHDELKAIAVNCITRHHAHHYLGFAETQWKLFEKESPPRLKPLLYVYRVLLTGIHLMRTGEVQANLVRLNETANLPHLTDLIDRKLHGEEMETIKTGDISFHSREYSRLRSELEDASKSSRLPETASAAPALHDLLLRLRLESTAFRTETPGYK